MKRNQFSDEQPITDPRVLAAVNELQELVRSHYPEATFSVGHGTDDPEAVHICATVDLKTPSLLLI